MFYQEAVIWKRLEHPNIVPFLGITSVPPQRISAWMPNGNLTEYVKQHPSADRLGLVSAPDAVFDPRLPPLPSAV